VISVKSISAVKNVGATSTDWTDYVVPAGKTIRVIRCRGAATHQGNTSVAAVWDRGGAPELLFLTYGDGDWPMTREFTGDGAKKISIRLKNASAASADLAGFVDILEL
jgi:hypothetical protein